MSTTPRPGSSASNTEVQNARINEAIAEDVAVGMAAKADHERAKANIYATQAARKAEVAGVMQQNAERAHDESRSTKFTLWLVLGIIAIGAIAAAAYFLSKPAPTETGGVSVPTTMSSPRAQASPGVVITNPNNARTNNGVPIVPPPASVVVVPAPTQNTVPAPSGGAVPAAPPVIRDNMNSGSSGGTTEGTVTSPAAPATPGSGSGTLEGYTEPSRP